MWCVYIIFNFVLILYYVSIQYINCIFFPTVETMSQDPTFKLLDPTSLVAGWTPLLSSPLHEFGISNVQHCPDAAKPLAEGYWSPLMVPHTKAGFSFTKTLGILAITG